MKHYIIGDSSGYASTITIDNVYVICLDQSYNSIYFKVNSGKWIICDYNLKLYNNLLDKISENDKILFKKMYKLLNKYLFNCDKVKESLNILKSILY